VGWVLIFEKPQSGRRRFWTYAEGNMRRNDTASSGAVLRSRRPQCTPRNFLHENRETSEAPVGAVLREFLEKMLQELPHRVRSERQDRG
jgi:hypothetical protein